MKARFYVLGVVAAVGFALTGFFAWAVVELGNCMDDVNKAQTDWCNNGPIGDDSRTAMYVAIPPLVLLAGMALTRTPRGLVASFAGAFGVLVVMWAIIALGAPLF